MEMLLWSSGPPTCKAAATVHLEKQPIYQYPPHSSIGNNNLHIQTCLMDMIPGHDLNMTQGKQTEDQETPTWRATAVLT